MIELIDKKSNKKLMALVICGIKYRDLSYLIYAVRREKEDANIFISKLVINSEGYTINNNFDNGEKEVCDDIVKKIINKTSFFELDKDGFEFINNVKLVDVNYFDVKDCYVSTVPRSLVKSIIDYYGFVNDVAKESPIVEIEDENKYNEGFVSNIVLIVFGIFLVLFCLGVMYGVFFK